MTVVNGRPLVAALMVDGTIRTVQLAEGNGWLDRGAFRAPFDVSRFELLPFAGRATAWAAGETGAGVLYHQSADSWTGPNALRTAEPLGPGTDRALAVAFGRLRFLYAGGDGMLTEQSFNPDGVSDAPATKGQVQPLPPDPRIQRIVQFAVMLLLMFVMLSTLRRRGSMQEAMRKVDKLSLAPLGSRFFAGLIDALPLLAVPAYVAFEAGALEGWTVRMNEPMIQAWEGAAVLIYLAHTTVSELMSGRTLGKRLLGLRVVNLDGSRAGTKTVLIRNVLRLVDITLALFPLVMIFLSPLRQRIGDVAAGTLVIRDGVVIPPPLTEVKDTPEEK